MAQAEFAVTTTARDRETVVVSVEGEVDLATAPQFEEGLRKAVELEASRVVVDLTATTFFDSSAIHALLSAAARLQSSGAQVCVVCSDPCIKKVLEITRADRVLDIHATVEQASSTSRLSALKPPGLPTRLSTQFVSREPRKRLPA